MKDPYFLLAFLLGYTLGPVILVGALELKDFLCRLFRKPEFTSSYPVQGSISTLLAPGLRRIDLNG